MLPRNHPDRIQIAFDDHRLVANAGLLLPATLALHLGLSQLVQQRLDLGDAPGRANPGDKIMTLVASARLQQALERVKQMNAKLKQKNSELEQASQAKSQILATVTHELKTPLTSVMGYVDRLLLHQDKVGPLNDRQQRYLETVQSSSLGLRALINDLLDISRIESGTLEITLTDLQAGEAIEEVVQATKGLIGEKQLRLLLNIPSSLPPVRADQLRFSQVINNLLSNACKYSTEGATIAITAKEVNNLIQIEFADTGIGISERDQSQLFTKFFRSDNSSTRSVSGIGLGLFITKHLVEAQGGEIWVRSQEGKGSTFSFSLPRADCVGIDEGVTRDSNISCHRAGATAEVCILDETPDQVMNGGNHGVAQRKIMGEKE